MVRPPPCFSANGSVQPFYLFLAWIKVWGVNIKQAQAFDVQPNTNTTLPSVVTTYLFPLVIHGLLVECLCLQRVALVGLAYSSHAGSERALTCTAQCLQKEGHLASCSLDLILIYWLYM